MYNFTVYRANKQDNLRVMSPLFLRLFFHKFHEKVGILPNTHQKNLSLQVHLQSFFVKFSQIYRMYVFLPEGDTVTICFEQEDVLCPAK